MVAGSYSRARVGFEQAAMYLGIADRATTGGEVDGHLGKAADHWERADRYFQGLPEDRKRLGNLHIERDRVRRLLDLWGVWDR